MKHGGDSSRAAGRRRRTSIRTKIISMAMLVSLIPLILSYIISLSISAKSGRMLMTRSAIRQAALRSRCGSMSKKDMP